MDWDELRQQIQARYERLHAGDQTAWDELARLLFRVLCAIIRRIVHEYHEAEDLTQETLLKILLKMGTFDPGRGSFLNWCIRIAINTALDFRRKKGRPGHAHPVSADDLEQVPEPEAEEEFPPEILDAFRECLAELPPEHRDVLDLDLEGMTNAAIAMVLAIAAGTVGSRKSRAVDLLRECLKRKLPDWWIVQ